MDFQLSQDQEMLADSALAFAGKSSPVTRFRKLRDDRIGWDKELWKQMGELGWLAVLFGEDVGGYGGTFVDIAIVLEKLGTTLVPEPILPSVILAGRTLNRGGSAALKQELLAPMALGEKSLALAWAERQARYDVCDVTVTAKKDGAGFKLTGEKIFVLNGHAADALLVSARTSGGQRERNGISIFAIDPKQAGVTLKTVKLMDGQKAAQVTLNDVAVGADRLVGPLDGAAELLERAMDDGAAAACAEGFGICQAVLELTVAYLGTREQFGVKIGSFQALQHRAVDMFVETELCRSTSILASLKVDDADPVERQGAISAAKVQLAMGGKYVTQQSIQLHGGIGLTDEHDIGLYFKRMHSLNTLFGDEEHHVTRFATLPSFTRGLEQR